MFFIRTDANEQIATGHMMRCKTIAHELNAMGKEVTFLVSDDDSTKLLNDDVFPFQVLRTQWDNLNTQDEIECIQNILKESYAMEKEFPILLVDSYYVKNIYFTQLKDYARIIFFDDMAEDVYDVDALINYNAPYENYFYGERYKQKNVRTILGTSYVPLRRQFGEEKAVKTDYTIKGRPKILLMSGGADSQNALGLMLNFFSHKADFDNFEYRVVTGAYHSHIEEMHEMAQTHANIKLMSNVDNMARLMKECDLAVIAAGTVLYECCAVGLPAILFTVADNQIPDAEIFSKRYGLPYLGDFRNAQENALEQIYAEIDSFVGNEAKRKNIGHVMHEIVDGKGSRRIAAIMARMYETGSFFEEGADYAFEASDSRQNPDGFDRGGVKLLLDGRTAIAAVLSDLEDGVKSRKVCFLPEYTCDTVILPFTKYNYKIYFYKIDRCLHIDRESFVMGLYHYKPDVVLLHSYYGCDFQENIYGEIDNFKKTYKTIVIEDLTQSLFLYSKAIQRADFVVCSLRKWFAIPEGGILIKTSNLHEKQDAAKLCSYPEREEYLQTKRMAQRLKRLYLCGEWIEKKSFLDLNNKAESMLYDFDGLYGMSSSTREHLCNIDISKFKAVRKRNANLLCDALTKSGVQVLVQDREAIPLYVPVVVENRDRLQEILREKEIYAPVLWPVPEQAAKVLSQDAEYIYNHLLAVPCDQRYDDKDMLRIIDCFDQKTLATIQKPQ